MGYRLSKITTRTGDDGKTSINNKERLPKNHLIIEALGTLDELNSAIGLLLSYSFKNQELRKILAQTQQDLFDLGGELCLPERIVITPEKTLLLEAFIEQWNATLPPLKEFILPGGTPASATCHLARAMSRRAERTLVALHQENPLHSEILRYINRLSDVLFIAARLLMKEKNRKEKMWNHSRSSRRATL
jgi:cob(I)alamin adenosyltransferase